MSAMDAFKNAFTDYRGIIGRTKFIELIFAHWSGLLGNAHLVS